MEVIVVLAMILCVAAFVFYPFFREQPAAAVRAKTKTVAKRKVNDDEIERMVLDIRQQKAKVCPRCGARNTMNTRYCSQCAASLTNGKRNG